MFGELPQLLAALRHARKALAGARTLPTIKAIRDRAEAAREYVKSASLGLDAQNRAAEIKLRAERKAGKLLAQLVFSRGGRPTGKNQPTKATSLRTLGINKSQSSRWQLEASVSDEVFEKYISQTKEAREEITSEGLIRLASQARNDTHERQRVAKRPKTRSEPDATRPSDTQVTAPGAQPIVQACREALEMIAETLNHQELLASVLEPVLSGQEMALPTAERRLVKTKLGETNELLTEVTEIFDTTLSGLQRPTS